MKNPTPSRGLGELRCAVSSWGTRLAVFIVVKRICFASKKIIQLPANWMRNSKSCLPQLPSEIRSQIEIIKDSPIMVNAR